MAHYHLGARAALLITARSAWRGATATRRAGRSC